jgi:hypothetical protein
MPQIDGLKTANARKVALSTGTLSPCRVADEDGIDDEDELEILATDYGVTVEEIREIRRKAIFQISDEQPTDTPDEDSPDTGNPDDQTSDPSDEQSTVVDDVAPSKASKATVKTAAQGTLQQTALNGAQITSVVEVCDMVAGGRLSKKAASALLRIALPLVDPKAIEQMVAAIEVSKTSSRSGAAPDGVPPGNEQARAR